MSLVLLNPKTTCEDCRVAIFDQTLGCLATDCHDFCIDCKRRAPGGCGRCTCLEIGFDVGPTKAEVTNCACTDGTVEKRNVITGAWFGAVIPDYVAEIAAHYCPENPHYRVYLWGSVYDFSSHTTSTDLNCPASTAGWQPLPLNGSAYQTDFVGAPLAESSGVFVGGAFYLSITDVGIMQLPPPSGAAPGSVSCSYEGGCVALMFEILLECDLSKRLVLCPFLGFTGEMFNCAVPPDYCEDWTYLETQNDCEVELTFTHVPGECHVTVTVTVGDEPPRVLDTADGETIVIARTIDPCPGGSLTVKIKKEWDVECIHQCASRNSEETRVFFA